MEDDDCRARPLASTNSNIISTTILCVSVCVSVCVCVCVCLCVCVSVCVCVVFYYYAGMEVIPPRLPLHFSKQKKNKKLKKIKKKTTLRLRAVHSPPAFRVVHLHGFTFCFIFLKYILLKIIFAMTFLKVFTEAGRVLSAAPAFTDSLRRARQLFYYDDYEEKKKIQ